MKKIKIYITLLLILIIASCAEKQVTFTQEYIDSKKESNSAIKSKILQDCPLPNEIIQNDILAANIYFAENNANINNADKDILNKIAYAQKKCSQALIIISHTSNKESLDKIKALELSRQRTKNIYNYLTQNKVNEFYLYTLSCSNLRNIAPEDSAIATEYNQRAELIFTNKKPADLQYFCLSEK